MLLGQRVTSQADIFSLGVRALCLLRCAALWLMPPCMPAFMPSKVAPVAGGASLPVLEGCGQCTAHPPAGGAVGDCDWRGAHPRHAAPAAVPAGVPGGGRAPGPAGCAAKRVHACMP